jgi:hypothetical protein
MATQKETNEAVALLAREAHQGYASGTGEQCEGKGKAARKSK